MEWKRNISGQVEYILVPVVLIFGFWLFMTLVMCLLPSRREQRREQQKEPPDAFIAAQESETFRGLEVLTKFAVNSIDKYFDAYGIYYTGGHYENQLIPFRLYTPKGAAEAAKKYPLFVFFHGRGNFGGNYKQLACLRDVVYDNSFFLLAASCNKQHDCWGTIEIDPDKRAECPAHVTLEIIKRIQCAFPVAEIHLIGYSDGTNAVSHMIKEGLKVKSAVYIGNEPPKENDVYFDSEGIYKYPETNLYFFYGCKDTTFPISAIKPFADKVKQSNGNIIVKELGSPYEGHDSYKYVLGEYKLIQQLIQK
jgi:predicted esterase